MPGVSAVGIGLLPPECEGKIVAVGNTGLRGAVRYLLDPRAEEKAEQLAETAEEILLSESKEFQEFYMEYLCFEEA